MARSKEGASMSNRSFIELCLTGDIVMDEIDDFVERWHEDASVTQPIHEFLGMTKEEYALWVEQPGSLRLILAAREENAPLYEAIERFAELEPVAARAADPEAAMVVLQWLRKTGRIKPA
jgi:hypothetical protein